MPASKSGTVVVVGAAAMLASTSFCYLRMLRSCNAVRSPGVSPYGYLQLLKLWGWTDFANYTLQRYGLPKSSIEILERNIKLNWLLNAAAAVSVLLLSFVE